MYGHRSGDFTNENTPVKITNIPPTIDYSTNSQRTVPVRIATAIYVRISQMFLKHNFDVKLDTKETVFSKKMRVQITFCWAD